jgi:hypothetical protein
MAITRLSLSSILNSPKSDSMLDGLVPVPFSAVATATDVGTGRAFNNAAASVAFAPLSVNGSYVVTANPSNPVMDPVIDVAGSSSPIVVTGLPSSAQYTFAVIATNQSGVVQGPFSSAVTVTSVPQAPTIGTATAGNTSATVAYTAGATGGKSVTYTATSSPGGFTGTGASPITVSGLTNGTAYTFTVTATNANGTSTASAASNSITPSVPDITSQYLIVAGGGGGGRGTTTSAAGGGGAGGVLYNSSYTFTKNSSYTVTIGAGGARTAGFGVGNVGNDSSISSVATASGGGYGAGSIAIPNGGPGGSGGGGQATGAAYPGGAGTSGQGNNGGTSFGSATTTNRSGGGGGGAGAVGGNAASSTPGNGGNGLTYFGSTYGGGGGGARNATATPVGTGGTGGGGNGSPSISQITAGTPNTGGGGGAGGQNSNAQGEAGGSGIVILYYPDSYAVLASTSGSPTYTVSGGFRKYVWNGTGGFTV